jgi:Flp pilus assembly protein protease CpaA
MTTCLDSLYLVALAMILLQISIGDLSRKGMPRGLYLALAVTGSCRAIYSAASLPTIAHEIAATLTTFAVLAIVRGVVLPLDRNAAIGAADIKFLVAAACWAGLAGSLAALIIAECFGIFYVLIVRPWFPAAPERRAAFSSMLAAGLFLTQC